MELEEKEQTETILKKLIEKVEKDDLPTNVFDIENTDPLVLLGKMNEIIKNLKLFASLVSESDEQSTEALEKAVKALSQAGEALEKSIQAEKIAQQGNETADKALDKSEVADSTAIEALHDASDAIQKANEAITKANEALEAVVEGQGTIVFDNHGKLLANAHFTGHNGINVDMSENDPETFDIRLDETITKAIEDNHIQGQSNKQRLDENDADIINLTEMLSHTEELAQKASEDIETIINPKLSDLEDKKVSKSFLDYDGNLVVIETSSDTGFSVRTYKGTTPNVQNLTGILSIGSTNTIIAKYDGQGNLKGRLKIDGNGILSYNDIPVSLNYAWQSINIASTAKSAGDHAIDLATTLPNWIDGAEYEVVVVIEAYESGTSYMQTSTDMFENSQSDQRFSSNGRQGGGIYTLPLKRYLKWHINSSLNTLYINIRAIRRTK